MGIKTVGIMSPGDMGHSVGQVLKTHGFNISTCLDGRSERTKRLALTAGFNISPTLEDLVKEVDIILSILVPSESKNFAAKMVDPIRRVGKNIYFADCNAISPSTATELSKMINDAGGKFIDGGIIGGPPTKGDKTRFYVSGKYAPIMSELDEKGIKIKFAGDEIGQASGIKMCYAALTKGTSTLQVALLTVAQKLGLTDCLRDELAYSQQTNLSLMESGIPRLPPNAHRWIGEMEEIAKTFKEVGITPNFHLGAVEIYKLLNSTSFSEESPENVDMARTVWQTIEAVADLIPEKNQEI